MILTDKELSQVKEQIDELTDRLRQLFKREDLSRFEVHVTATGYDKMIGRLSREVEEYEERHRSDVHRA